MCAGCFPISNAITVHSGKGHCLCSDGGSEAQQKNVSIAFVIDGGHKMRCKARFISQSAHCRDVFPLFHKHVFIDSRDDDLQGIL